MAAPGRAGSGAGARNRTRRAAATTPARLEDVRQRRMLRKAKVRLNDVSAVWPAPRPSHPATPDDAGWVPNKPQQPLALGSLGVPFKTTIRLTHAQARAVKLAALILDKPQQDILTAGLIERLEALACADLAKCSCFKAVIEGLTCARAPAPVEEPPLAY